jgi:hypothetical protein
MEDFEKAYQFYRTMFKKIEKHDIGNVLIEIILKRTTKVLKMRRKIFWNSIAKIKETSS